MAFSLVGNYPPQIEGKIIAQYGTSLRIPFTIGYATNKPAKIYARLKTIVSNNILGILETSNIVTENGVNIAIFVNNINLEIGQYYKIQLSFDNSIYSTIGIFRYTSIPTLTINNLDSGSVSTHQAEYVAQYSNTYKDANGNEKQDSGEQVYQYEFILMQGSNLLETSGILTYEIGSDSALSYRFKTGLKERQLYSVQCIVYTTGGIKVTSKAYLVKKQDEYKPQTVFILEALQNIEKGAIDVTIRPEKNKSSQTISGQYLIFRASATDNFNIWEQLGDIKINTIIFDKSPWIVFSDKTIQQGIAYKYAIQQYNDNIYTTKFETDAVICDFEDAFLSDGERQLKIRYNPKVASFKNVNLEQKTDTIGSRYPFIFRNGYTNYKEFSISGLISLLMDDTDDFMSFAHTDETMVRDFLMTDLVGENITNERLFKLEVLNWLTNGKPKLFRSPTEGNYIVRLMNTSLAPNETLGRMLHTFNTTAYEIAPFNHNSLNSLGLISQIKDNADLMNIKTIHLIDHREITTIPVYYGRFLRIRGATPGAKFKIQFNDIDTSQIDIQIGRTGYYEYDADGNNYISAITINPQYTGTIEIGQYGQQTYPMLDIVDGETAQVLDYGFKERFSQYFSTDKEEEWVNIAGTNNWIFGDNMSTDTGHLKREIVTNICVLHVENRYIQEVDDIAEVVNINPIYIYKTEANYYFPMKSDDIWILDKNNSTTALNTILKLGDQNIEMGPMNREQFISQGRLIYTLHDFGGEEFLPDTLEIGNGLIAHMYYTVMETEYEKVM